MSTTEPESSSDAPALANNALANNALADAGHTNAGSSSPGPAQAARSHGVPWGALWTLCGLAGAGTLLALTILRASSHTAAPEIHFLAPQARATSGDSNNGPLAQVPLAEIPLTVPAWESRTKTLVTQVAGRPDGYLGSAWERFGLTEARSEAGELTEIPPERRWQFVFEEGINELDYAKQLDTLGIELGVIRGDGKLDYASQVSQGEPRKREGTVPEEDRLYMTFERGDLLDADREILARAGIEAAGKIILHFYSPATEQKLATLEGAFRNQTTDKIALTRFGFRRAADRFEIVVIEQRLRD